MRLLHLLPALLRLLLLLQPERLLPLQPETLALSGTEGLATLLDALEEELRLTRRKRAQLFNVHFGSVFRTQV